MPDALGTAAAPLRLLLVALTLSLTPLGMAQGPEEPANDPRVREVASQLTCYCGCNTQSIAECTCGVARKSRLEIQASLRSGETPERVVAAWVERFGPRILLEPPPRGFNLLGWFLPGAVLLLVGAGLVLVIHRWNRRTQAAAEATDEPQLDPRYLEQLEHEVRRMNS